MTRGRAYLHEWIVSLCGGVADLAQRLMVRRKTRRDLLAWLAPAEALARRLLLLKALGQPKPNTPPAPPPAAGRLATAFTDKPRWALDEDPAKWRVRFSVLPSLALRRASPAQDKESLSDPRGGGIRFDAYPLARWIEALRRVLENPEPALKRLARLLATRRPALVACFGPYRHPHGIARSMLPAAQEALEIALLNTS